jgi:uncharacterized protein YjbI with pentapeptide repeats
MKKIIPLILSTLLLTSCSGPDSSGGVEFSKTDNAFPYGDCRGSGYQTHVTYATWCGWIKNYYILTGANLSGANLSGADLSGGAKLHAADLSGADLRNADLSYANLSGANLSGANLTNVNLGNANLNGANLSGANLYLVSFYSASLNGANLRNATHLISTSLQGVKVNSSTICPNGKSWYYCAHNENSGPIPMPPMPPMPPIHY